MKTAILLGTLKRGELSNTATLCEFLAGRMERRGIGCDIIRLAEYNVPPGTLTRMGEGDDWPDILRRLSAAQAVLLATPVWWGNHSSLIQRAIERLDALHDDVMAGKGSLLDGKVGALVITGDSDGAQHIIGNACNFLNAIGLVIPPYASLSVLWERQAKGKDPTREELLAWYSEHYTGTADRLVENLLRYAR
jgi:multimeric flavodoxin WrbA